MRKIILAVAIICQLQLLTNYCCGQYVTIPDARFFSALQANGLSTCLTAGPNLLDTSCAKVLQLKTLNCFQDDVSDITGIQYFKNLDTLIIGNNGVANYNNLPATLKYLDCSANYIGKNFSEVSLPASLSTLICYEMALDSLPHLPATLTYLDCSDNSITKLSQLPSGLQYLFCGGGGLASLPTSLPPSLLQLNCQYASIAALPQLPPLLNYLECSSNQITTIPALPSSLIYLGCANNQITEIPPLPNKLYSLYCSFNPITSLPDLPSSLLYLQCAYTQITTLPPLPDTMGLVYLAYDSSLTCLPPINFIDSLIFFNTKIACVPDRGHVGLSEPDINSIPLCSVYDPNHCTVATAVNQLTPITIGGQLTIFPNPSDGEFQISDSKFQIERIEIYNLLGEKIIEQQMSPSGGGSSEGAGGRNIDLTNQPAGIYFVRVYDANGNVSAGKVVKE